LRAANSQYSRAYSELTRRVDTAFYRLLPKIQTTPPGDSLLRAADAASRVSDVDGLDALLASFYNTLQDRYRGSREEIKGRLQKYLPDVHSVVASARKPVLDLGAGRGEWLELLAAEGLAAEGVDTNAIQIGEAADWNIVIHNDDFRAFLSKCPPASFAVISAFHLVEHLAFDTLTWLAREAMRVLTPDGLLLIETPNPRNVLVGATTFHADPTHIKPLPPEVLETLFESIGFHPVEVRLVHPHEKLEVFLRERRVDAEIAYLLFGAQDTAVLAHKPALGFSATA
jgi:O-antigen chain-terminating methyltransferase